MNNRSKLFRDTCAVLTTNDDQNALIVLNQALEGSGVELLPQVKARLQVAIAAALKVERMHAAKRAYDPDAFVLVASNLADRHGFSLDALRAVGWTDDALLSRGWAYLASKVIEDSPELPDPVLRPLPMHLTINLHGEKLHMVEHGNLYTVDVQESRAKDLLCRLRDAIVGVPAKA
ncbi:MAG TPA: hypothetical protein VF680_17525 [Allosphingosinicella sp.]|jgi:hypothetical protein